MLPPSRLPFFLQRRTLLLGMMAAGAGSALSLRPSPGSVPQGTIPFGAYDPGGDFSEETDFLIEHLFLPWEDVAIESLFDADRYARDRDRALLVTLEPWTWSRSERNTPEGLRNGISDGAYDATMRSICEVLAALESPLTLRWGHEMDDDNGQFIWAGWQPEEYISAYRRMTGIARETVPGINLMWSPLGDDGMQAYYPGDDHVDLTGLSVFGLQAWDRAKFGRDRSFGEILAPRYDRAMEFGKPVVVAELGYSGNAAYLAAWDRDIRSLATSFPALVGVVYFNYPEVYDWPEGFGRPDWRVNERLVEMSS
jgi:endoglucanase